MKTIITLLVFLTISSGYFVNESFAEISENQAFLLEGSGFAVTQETIKISEIDLGLSSQNQRGSTINFLTEDGFITLGNEEFIISNLEGKFLREGKYIRVNGEIESSSGFDTSISFFGRLVDEFPKFCPSPKTRLSELGMLQFSSNHNQDQLICKILIRQK